MTSVSTRKPGCLPIWIRALVAVACLACLCMANVALAADSAAMRPFRPYATVRLGGFSALPPYPKESFGNKFPDIKDPNVPIVTPEQKYAGFAAVQTPQVSVQPYVAPPPRALNAMRPITQGAYAPLPRPAFAPYAKFSAFSK